jgi:hypothetical protein
MYTFYGKKSILWMETPEGTGEKKKAMNHKPGSVIP